MVPQNYLINIDQQYADDISKISTSITAIEKMKDELPIKLVQRGLKMNELKTSKEPTVTIVRETVNYLVAY